MAEFKISKILKSDKGQSAVEYLLLMAVLASITYTVFHNPEFKKFMSSDSGVFASMRRGMIYSYRYGRDITTSENPDNAMSFEYNGTNHELYVNQKESATRFFMGTLPYGDQ